MGTIELMRKINLPIWKEDYDLILRYQVLKGKKNLMDSVHEIIGALPAYNVSDEEIESAIEYNKRGYGVWRLKIIKAFLEDTMQYLIDRKSKEGIDVSEIPIIDAQVSKYNTYLERVNLKLPKPKEVSEEVIKSD